MEITISWHDILICQLWEQISAFLKVNQNVPTRATTQRLSQTPLFQRLFLRTPNREKENQEK